LAGQLFPTGLRRVELALRGVPLLLAVYLAVYPAAWAWLVAVPPASATTPGTTSLRNIRFAVCGASGWVALDWLRCWLFTGFGWTGVVCTKQGLGLPVTLAIAFVVGSGLMIAIFLMMRAFMRLQSNGNIDYGNAVGQLGTVYVTIPPVQRSGGQVETMIQGRLVTAEALQKGSQPLQPGTKVNVVARIGSSTLIVEPLD
jgi:hypothetical protein